MIKKAHDDAFTNKPLSKPVCFFQSVDVNLSSRSLSIVFWSGILNNASAKHNRTVPSSVLSLYSCKRFSIGLLIKLIDFLDSFTISRALLLIWSTFFKYSGNK